MGCGNPPALTSMEEEQDKQSLSTKPSGADDSGQTHVANVGGDIMSFPFSQGYAHFPRNDSQGDCRSYSPVWNNENNRLCGYMDTKCATNPESYANLVHADSVVSEFCTQSEMSSSDVSVRELCQTIAGNNTVSSSNYHESEFHKNIMPPMFETVTGYPIKAHGAEARNSRVSRSPMTMSGNFSSSECSTSALPLVDNFGVAGNKNDSNNVPLPSSSPQIVDGSFLTLGIGGSTDIRSNSNFSTQEIASKLEDALPLQCNRSPFGQTPVNSSNLTQLMDRAARTQIDAGGLSSSGYNLTGRMSSNDKVGFGEDTSSRLNSALITGLHTPQSNTQSIFEERYDPSLFGPAPSSLPSRSSLITRPEYAAPSPLAPEISEPIDSASQSMSRKTSVNSSSESSKNHLSDRRRGSSINHAQLGKLIPIGHGRTQSSSSVRVPVTFQPAGNLTSLADNTQTEVARFGFSPSSVQQLGHVDTSHNVGSVGTIRNSSCPERIGFQISQGSGSQSAAGDPFPKRLGVQPNDFAIARTTRGHPPIHLGAPPFRPILSSGQYQHALPPHLSMDFPRVDYSRGHTPIHLGAPPFRPIVSSGTSIKSAMQGQYQHALPPHLSMDFPRVDYSRGRPPIHLGAPPFRPIVSSGQYQHALRPQFSKDFPRVDYSRGHVMPGANLDIRNQPSPAVSHPSLKRQSIEDSPTVRWAQRRKIYNQPVINHPMSSQTLDLPASVPAGVYNPPEPLHIKWQGDEPFKPNGQKCLLCKRDLIFAAEGPVTQPTTAPPVAVLPCGHTFHDHCLNIITPEDESKTPPCIPCALGET